MRPARGAPGPDLGLGIVGKALQRPVAPPVAAVGLARAPTSPVGAVRPAGAVAAAGGAASAAVSPRPGAAASSPSVKPAVASPAASARPSAGGAASGSSAAPARSPAKPAVGGGAAPLRPAAAAGSASAPKPSGKPAASAPAGGGTAAGGAKPAAAGGSGAGGGAVAPAAVPEAAPAAPAGPAPAPAPAPPAAAEEAGALDGDITIRYNHYRKTVPIAGGCVRGEDIDEQLALTFVFPGCVLHLAADKGGEPAAHAHTAAAGVLHPDPSCGGAIPGVRAGSTYWVLVEEDPAEKAAAEARQAEFYAKRSAERAAAEAEAAKTGSVKVERMESCSCIEGNPCAQPYNCKDWNNRFAVAKAHGWKGHT